MPCCCLGYRSSYASRIVRSIAWCATHYFNAKPFDCRRKTHYFNAKPFDCRRKPSWISRKRLRDWTLKSSKDTSSALISSNDASIENDWLTPVATRATEKRDLLAVINDNIADFSPAAERKRTLGTHELLKVGDGDGDGDGGIRLPLALHKEWSRNKFESPMVQFANMISTFLRKWSAFITRPGELDHHQLVHWQKELNRYW